MLTVKIITTSADTLTWPSLKGKLRDIKKTLETTGSRWHVSIEYRNLTPEVHNGRITHRWFDTTFGDLNDFVVLHMSEADRTRFGVKPSLRGSVHVDSDDIGEMYVWSDEDTLRGKYSQFTQTILHELRHEICRGIGVTDNTHALHGQDRDIRPHFKHFNMKLYRPKRQAMTKVLRSALIQLIKRLSPEKKYDKYPKELRPIVKKKAEQLVAAFDAIGMPIRIVEGVRSCERQNELYAQGRTKPGNIVTNAKCGESMHQYGIAVDFVFRREGYDATDEQWEILGRAGEALGFKWGGRWNGFVDRPHHQYTLGHTLADFQKDRVDWSKWDT